MGDDMTVSAGPTREIRKFNISKSEIGVIAVLFLVAVMVAQPNLNIIITFLIAPLMLWLFFYDEFYLLLPVFMLFTTQLLLKENMPLARFYIYLLLIKLVFTKKSSKLNAVMLPALVVFFLYCGFTIMGSNLDYQNAAGTLGDAPGWISNLRLATRTMLDLVIVYLMAYLLIHDKKICQRFFVVLVVAVLLSGLYGYRAQNVMEYSLGMDANTGTMLSIVRHKGSLEDPNYFGFYVNIAIVIVLSAKVLQKPYLRYPLLVALYYFLLASGSLTSLACNVAVLFFYIVLKYKKAAPIALVILGTLTLGAYLTATNLPVIKDMTVIQNVQLRIERQIYHTEDNEVISTSGRTDLWEYYTNFYKKQDTLPRLFGGNIMMSSVIEPKFLEEPGHASHMVYIQFLLNFGLLGTLVLLLCFIAKACGYAYRYFKENEPIFMTFFLCSCIWLIYGASLDYFPNWIFMLFYFL